MASASGASYGAASRRTHVLAKHLRESQQSPVQDLIRSACLQYSPPEMVEVIDFDRLEMRKLMDGHDLEYRDWLFGLIIQSELFNRRKRGGKVFVSPDYNQSMEQQREITVRRIEYLRDRGVFRGWLSNDGAEAAMRRAAFFDVVALYDHSLSIKLGVHLALWGSSIRYLGTRRHHDRWVKPSEDYTVKGCFAMTELGHGSNVRGIETVATYDSSSKEFVIVTPCESAQKYWIGGAGNDATHAAVFAQLVVGGINHGVHAFVVQIRDGGGNICPNVRIADCGHKIGLNGVDNGRIWFDGVRIHRENLLNSVADVTEDGKYVSAIRNPDQRFAAFLSPLTSGRVTLAVSAVYASKMGLTVAIRYALTRRAFAVTPGGAEVLLLDYPSHQRRLLPALAKAYAMSFAGLMLKKMVLNRSPESSKSLHVYSSGLKAVMTWENMKILQECREACGGQGLKTENRIGQLKSEYDVQSTFEGDNNVLMHQVSKALFSEYLLLSSSEGTTIRGGLSLFGLHHVKHRHSPLTTTSLRSSQLQADIFGARESDLLKRFVDQVLKLQSDGLNRERAFTESYEVGQDLGRAFSQRVILEEFIKAETVQPAGPLRDVLGLLRSLYALCCVDEDVAFLRYGHVSVDTAAVVRDEVSKLCSEIRPHAYALVTSFGIPDAFLGPIAFDWVDANSWSVSN